MEKVHNNLNRFNCQRYRASTRLGLALLFAFIIIGIHSCKSKQVVDASTLPSFNLLLLDSSTMFNTSQIASGKPIVLFYFSTRCRYCMNQTQQLLQGMDTLKDANFYFFSEMPFSEIKGYAHYFKLNQYINITVGRDVNSFFKDVIDAEIVPWIMIYDHNKQLKKIIVGMTSVSVINSFLKN